MINSVGIIGIGIVGSAMRKSFINKGITVKAYDKNKDYGNLHDVLDTDIIFLSLPSQVDIKTSLYNIDAIKETCKYLKDNEYKGLVILKSTVEPGTTTQLILAYHLRIMHNPEFLNFVTANYDFHEQDHIVLGINEAISEADLALITNFYSTYYSKAHISVCSSNESEAMKILANSFYAIKIQTFNEFYLYCKKNNLDYNNIKNMILNNGYVNPMHTDVPDVDNNLSYGGTCLPKDTTVMCQLMKKSDIPAAIITACVDERKLMRKD